MSEPRTRQLNVLLSEDERAMLDLLAEEYGVTASDVVRMLIRREREVSRWLTPLQRAAVLAALKRGDPTELREIMDASIRAIPDANIILPDGVSPEDFAYKIVEAPGDLCGNTQRLPDGSYCPGCRACR